MLILDLLYFLLLSLTWPFWIARFLKPSQRRLLRGRLRPQLEPLAGNSTVWIHAVSVGEVRSLRSLVSELESRGRRIVLSVTTPSGFDFARREMPDLAVILSPLDLSFVVRRFIDRIQPQLVIFNELEIWPNWISLLRRRRIPMLLINGRVSQKAFRRYRFFRPVLRPFFRGVDGFLVQNELYRQRFMRLHIPAGKITVCGNIKADEAMRSIDQLPPPQEVRSHLRLADEPRKIVVLASSHPRDEEVFVPAIPDRGDGFFFIIVPRHVQRAPAIAARLQRLGISQALFSHQPAGNPGLQVLVYDRMGFLLPIMSIADIVFMGGTFDPHIGGHNLYEPAALGKTIVGGPHCNNFPDIGRELKENGAYHAVNGSNEWREFLAAYPGFDSERSGASARKAVAGRKGSLACSLEQIERYLA
jgi:3-deoxy-D-manno-octulosonic-acid transferase